MRVAFVLPAPVRVPMGGAAVVFHHAEGLAARGHEVTVIAPRRAPGAWPRVRRLAVVARDRWHGVADVRTEVAGVRVVEPATAAAAGVGALDAVIATGSQTAPWALSLDAQERFYFLQGDERALSPRAEATWALPLRRFAVSHWLADLVAEAGHPVEGVVPNAIDPTEMYPTAAPADRPCRVVALYHRHPVKGPETLVDALERLRAAVPDVAATLVSARPPSHRLPPWVDLRLRPTRDEMRGLYNKAAVCLHTSTREGWGLVPMEAAACGCAVVATASLGPREFLSPGESMVEVGVGDAAALAAASARLLRDVGARVGIAEAGLAAVARSSWAASTDRLEAILRTPRPA